MSRYIALVAMRLSWGIRLYSLPSLVGGLQVYLMCGLGLYLFFTALRELWVSWIDAGMNDSRRELIPQGQTGGLIIFEDHPNYWDAWGTSHGTYTSQRGFFLLMENFREFRCRDTSS